MTTADGTVVGATKIVDNGTSTQRYNLVVVAEGYRSTELTQFHTDCDALVQHLFSTPPFDELSLRCAFNVYRVDVSSTDSGADNPSACGGDGSTRATYFDATFCGDGKIQRLLTVNATEVINVVNAQVPAHHQIIVIVNSSTYGGSGGAVAVTSTGGNWLGVAMHELGHAVFSLADEYPYWQGCGSGETGHDHYTGPEFAQVNISATADRATIKWAALVAAATAMPTTTNADCSDCDSQGLPAGLTNRTIGAFEGAGYNHCGAWRPAFRCMMLDLSEFCDVCKARIRTVLAPYTQPTNIILATPGIAFVDVPAGTTTVRAVRFSITSCAPFTFTIVSGPTRLTGPPSTVFGTPLGTATTSPAGSGTPVPRDALIWISYTGTAAGDSATGTVTIRCMETGTDYVIPITANTVTRPVIAVALVLDKSGSMLWDAGDGRRRIDVLHDSALPFADLLPDDDAVCIVAFDQDAHDVMPVAVAGPPVFGSGRTAAKAGISAHQANPAGSTAIGDGVERAHQLLDPLTGYAAKATVVLTDGQETDAKYIADVAGLITERVYAIGLGTASDINPVALTALTNGTGGYLLMTGALDSNDFYRLSKYYLQILAAVTNHDIVLDPDGFVAPGAAQRISFLIAETDIEMTAILLSPAPWAMDFALEAPDGDIITPTSAPSVPGAIFATSQNNAYYRLSMPAVVNGRPAAEGTWNAILDVDRGNFAKYMSSLDNDPRALEVARSHGLRFSLNVHTLSNLRLSARLSQTSNTPGATLKIRALLTEYGVAIANRATVGADVERPDGSTATFSLTETDPGSFELSVQADLEGIYTVRLTAYGQTLRGQAFTREHTLTGAVWQGGNREPPVSGGGIDWCQLMLCLLENGFLDDQAQKRLEEHGVHLDVLHKCLEGTCP